MKPKINYIWNRNERGLATNTLRNPHLKYDSFYNEIKKADTWWHYLDSTWLIKTQFNPQYWYNKLAPLIYQNDSIFIIEVTNKYQGWLPKEAWEWLNRELPPVDLSALLSSLGKFPSI